MITKVTVTFESGSYSLAEWKKEIDAIPDSFTGGFGVEDGIGSDVQSTIMQAVEYGISESTLRYDYDGCEEYNKGFMEALVNAAAEGMDFDYDCTITVTFA